jgi:hypothetical protein
VQNHPTPGDFLVRNEAKMREPPVKAKEGIYTCQELSHLGLSGRRKAKKRGAACKYSAMAPIAAAGSISGDRHHHT